MKVMMSRKKEANNMFKKKQEVKDVGLIKDFSSSAAQAVIRLQTNIEYSSIDSKIKTIAVTSAEQSAGKSTMVGNLALLYSQRGMKVLIIDTDIRKSSISTLFGISNKVGLVDYIMGNEENLKKVIKTVQGIDIITSGTYTPFPAKVLQSEKFEKLINSIKDKYDYILIDTPPIIMFSDAMLVSNVVDGYLVICAQHISRKGAVADTVGSLKSNGMNVIGLVMDRATEDVGHYGYGYSDYSKYYSKDRDDSAEEQKK
jgi:capsular exopolysaccharide synthesis family protein